MPMYDIAPETILNKSLDPKTGKEFQEIYDFHRISSIEKRQARDNRYVQKIDSYGRKLRDPLNIGEKVFILSSRIRKKDVPGSFYKPTTENKPYYNRKEIFTIKKVALINDVYNYWLKEESSRFIGEELFALQNQIV